MSGQIQLMLCLLFLPVICPAQKQVDHQQMMWYGYFHTFVLDKSWFIITELQERHFVSPLAQHQFLLRSHLHRQLGSRWDMAAGLSVFIHQPNDPTNPNRLSVPELRPHLEWNFKQSLRLFQLQHRYKIEFRIFQNSNSTQSLPEDGFAFQNLRFRYRFQAMLPVRKWNDHRVLHLKVSDEIFLNAGEKIVMNLFDQNQLFAGLHLGLSPALAVEAGYMKLIQQRNSGIGYFSKDIIRLSVHHSMGSNESS